MPFLGNTKYDVFGSEMNHKDKFQQIYAHKQDNLGQSFLITPDYVAESN